MSKTLNVAAYCRVSTETDDQLNSLASQQRYFADYIRRQQNWKLIHIYYDEGISGTQARKRPGFRQMIADAKEHKLDLILTKEVSRFARNTMDALYYTRMLKEMGIGVVFAIDNIDTRDCDGELRLTIMASIAQEESRKISQRVKWGQKRSMEQGTVFGAGLFGYHLKDGRLSIHPEEAELVRFIFQQYTDEGKGTWLIAKELNERSEQSKSSFSPVFIYRMLKNEKYAGDLCQKKTITTDYLTHQKKTNRGEEDMVYLPDHHPAIISRDLWERTQKELAARSRKAPRPSPGGAARSGRHWCSQKLVCGICRCPFVLRQKRTAGGELYQAWRCQNAARHGTAKTTADGQKTGCSNPSVNQQTLFSCLREILCRLTGPKQDRLIEELCHELADRTRSTEQKQLKQQQKKLAEVRQKKQRLVELYLTEMISRQEFELYRKQYDQKEQSAAAVSPPQKTEDTGQLKETLTQLFSFHHTPWLYREVIDCIECFPGGILVFQFHGLPEKIKVQVRTGGKGRRYWVEIKELSIVLPAPATP